MDREIQGVAMNWLDEYRRHAVTALQAADEARDRDEWRALAVRFRDVLREVVYAARDHIENDTPQSYLSLRKLLKKFRVLREAPADKKRTEYHSAVTGHARPAVSRNFNGVACADIQYHGDYYRG